MFAPENAGVYKLLRHQVFREVMCIVTFVKAVAICLYFLILCIMLIIFT
jgi:hypothetical protein